MTRCTTHHPDGRRCLLPVHPGKHLIATGGPADRSLQLRIVTAWDYPAAIREECCHPEATAEEIAIACSVVSNLLLEPYRAHLRRSALPSISATVGEA